MTLRIRLHRLLAVIAVFVALIVALPALAQTTGKLRGVVKDSDDFGLPRAEVMLEGDSMIGGAQKRTTDDDGNYQFVELLPGTYKLTVSHSAMSTTVVEGIVVQIGGETRQDVVMSSVGDEEVIVEAEKKVVDVADTSRRQVLTREFLERVPTGRSYQSAVTLANGVVDNGGGNPNMGGAAYNENTYLLDGANITDPVTGTFSLNFNYDAIEQIEVLLGGFMPEYGQSLGGVINIVTQTGNNNLEFDSSVFYLNGNWSKRLDARYTADGFQLAPTDFDSSYQSTQVNARLSGPVVRDRAWFMISYQLARSLIANTGVALPRDYEGHYVLAKLTFQPNSEHRFTSFLQLDPTNIDNLKQNDIFVKPEAQTRQAQGGYTTQFRWQWFLGSEANLDTQVVVQKSYIESGSVPCTHNAKLGYHRCRPGEREGEEDWDTPGRLGSYGAYDSTNAYFFQFDDRFRYQASSKLTLLSLEDPLEGTHDVKVGVEGSQIVWTRLMGFTGNTLYADMNTTGWDPLSFQNFYRYEFSGPVDYSTSGSQWNMFIQDSYKPVRNLVIRGGFRYDNAVLRNDVGDAVVTQSLWGPRLYASWDPFGDQKTKIAGGYGRFNDVGRLGVADFTRQSSFGQKIWYGEYRNSFTSDQEDMVVYFLRENPSFAHDKLKAPRSDEFNLMVHREIMRDVGIKLDLTYKRTRFIFEQDEINLIRDQDGSAIIGSRIGDPQWSMQRLRTPELARRNYVQGDLTLLKQESRRWFAQATYTYSLSLGTSRVSMSGSFLNDPQTQYNFGPMYESDLRHVVKGFGGWRLPTDPWNQTIGVSIQYFSGRPMERRYLGEGVDGSWNFGTRIRPRGIYTRYPDQFEASIQFKQEFDVRRGKLNVQAMLLNAFSNRAARSVSAALNSEDRLFIFGRQQPTRFQIGAGYEF